MRPPLYHPDLFADRQTPEQKFEAWRQTPGGKHILHLLYRKAACYAARYQRTGRRVSVRLLWEQLRDHVSHYGPKLKAKLPAKVDGYRLNDHFHAPAARHIIAHRPEWRGMFEFREIGKVRVKRKVIVIEEAA
jgi:hypothetical protein